MAFTVKHKRSGDKDKAPAAGVMTPGELAINYNVDSPAAYIKDSAGNIVKLAGAGSVGSPDASETVKGIAEIATKAEVTAGTDDARIVSPLKLKQALDALPPGTTVAAAAPGTPEDGQAWFDTTISALKVWDGAAWKTSQPAASETVAGIAEIATKAEVTAGTDDAMIVSPLKLKQALDALPPGTTVAATAPLAPESGQAFFDTTTNTLKIWDGTAWKTSQPAASETVAGIAELATQAEVTTGTDDATIVTPLKLATAVPAATETKAGKAEIATQAEVTAGTDDERIVTPLKLKQAVDALPPGTTVSATAPTTPEDGQAWFDSTNNILKVWDGTAWKPAVATSAALWDEKTGGLIPATATNNLYVGGTAAAPKINLKAAGSATFASQQFRIEATGELIIDSPATVDTSNVFSIRTAANSGNEVASIKADGSAVFASDVKIGGTTSTPNIKLNQNGSSYFRRPLELGLYDLSSTGVSGVTLLDSGGMYQQGSAGYQANTQQYRMYWGKTLTQICQVDGTMKIGGTIPASPNISLNADGSATFASGVVSGDLTANHVNVAGTSGQLNIRRDGASQKSVRILNDAGSGQTEVASITNKGDAEFKGTVTATVVPPSDAKFKENITPANPQLADVVALGKQLKNFDWNSKAPLNDELRAVRQLGLIAQEAEKVSPGIVKTIKRTKRGKELTPEKVIPAVYKEVVDPQDEENFIKELVTPEQTIPATYEQVDDSFKGISHDALIMKLLGAIAELSAEVDALKAPKTARTRR